MTFSLRTPSGDSLLVPDDVSIEVSVDEDGLMRLSTELYVDSVDIEADSVQSFAGRPSSGTTTGPSSPMSSSSVGGVEQGAVTPSSGSGADEPTEEAPSPTGCHLYRLAGSCRRCQAGGAS
ncbi:MAG: hypothetical protein KIA99_04545 [Actinomyces urogenitalis]|uniref:hypothetical protein n=1 Tax=Actinomyces urogenitalis TaxID=103621 RepID=UPI002432B278|nr:hypothetical protein [Actinomyces urogenitalis]MBS5976855.1 hypothetical protein [Actinomyces urogenitalis]